MRFRSSVAYIWLVSALGVASLGYSLAHWQTQDWTRYAFYCAIALIASRMKVSLPGVTGTMSMNFLFVLLGIAELSLAETMVMGSLAMLVQCLLYTKQRPQPVQVLFSVASMACSIIVAFGAYHSPLGRLHALEQPLMLLVAAGVFFLTNTLSIALVIALTEGKRVWAVWRDSYFWSFPNYLVAAAVAWLISASIHLVGWQSSLLLLPILYVIYRSHSLYIHRLEEAKQHAEAQQKHAEEVVALHRRTIHALALAIEAKDQTTHDHLERVEVYAIEVAKELGLDESQLEALRAAALLHDIGKLAVPEHIISKPGKLTPEEFEKMKIHPVVGAEILEQVRFPYAVAPIVRSHHEKWDGTGYPDGLEGDQIPIGSRILSAVDCLDALSSDRQYRRALPLDEAIKIVEQEGGKAFDPKVVEVLVRRYVELEHMAKSGEPTEKAKLSTDVKVERGAAPAAGFETTRTNGQTADPASQDLLHFHRSVSGTKLDGLMAALDQCRGRERAFELVREEVRTLIPYHALAIYERTSDRLLPVCLDGDNYNLFSSLEIPLGMGLSGWVAENEKAIVNGNPSVEPGYLNDPAKFSTLRSALAIPIKTCAGTWGVLSLYHQDRDAFTEQDRDLAIVLGGKLGGAMERSRGMIGREGPPPEMTEENVAAHGGRA
jgi:putative nucleotidyltransferase with HDIG domain